MIKLVAIDLDGTLFDSHSAITEENKKAIMKLSEHGIYPVISTGRPYMGIPEALRKELPFAYAITANGAGIYKIDTEECIHEDPMSQELFLPILEFLESKDIHMDAFMNGRGLSTFKCLHAGNKLPVSPELLEYILNSRERVESLKDYIIENNKTVQKMTLNFYPDGNGNFVDREEVRLFLENHPDIDSVCGGYNNLEFTKKGVNKGVALRKLADHLGLTLEETMAIGDTENDLTILQTAGVGVAMQNATEDVKAVANYTTLCNDESGVAHAIYHFCEGLN